MKRVAIILIAFFAISTQVQAVDIVTGIFFHDVANLFGCSKAEGGLDLGVEAVFGEGIIRPNTGITINARGETSKVYAGFVLGTTHPGLFASFSFGGAIQINSVRKLGSALLFRLAIEVGYTIEGHQVSIILDHISNADLADQNAGLDILGIRYGYRF